jgi:hypothetical protein
VGHEENAMPIALATLLARTEAQLSAETDPVKRASLAQDIAAFKRTMKKSEEDDEEDEDDEDKKKSKSKKAAATKSKKMEEEEEAAAKGSETDRKEKKAKRSEEEEEAALSEIARVAISMTGALSADALRGKLKSLVGARDERDALVDRLDALEKKDLDARKAKAIQDALRHSGGPRITRADAKWLEGQSMAVVESFLAEHTRPIVNVEGSELLQPKDTDGKPNTDPSGLSEAVLAQIDLAVSTAASQGMTIKRETLIAAQNRAMTNGKAKV